MTSRVIPLVAFLFCIVALAAGQPQSEPEEQFLPIGLTDEEKTRLHEIGERHRATAPPTGTLRNPAEWEPSEGVLVRWPLGIPVALVAEMSEDVVVTTIVANSAAEQSAFNTYSSGGVNMANVAFIHAPTNSIWVRDYGPWFIFENNQLAIVDHVYNRPRPLDDVVPQTIGAEWGLDVYGMSLNHAGGNHMSDGLGMSASTEMVYLENTDNTPAEIDQTMLDYLGNDYTVLDYIQPGGIHHIDCWAKYLGPSTVLVKDVVPSDPTHDDLDAHAEFLSRQISPWGVPYNVVRIYCPTGTYYTNSLILNDKVFVPLFGNSQDSVALETYADAMPGYEVLGFTGSWATEDALHCRAMGVPDRQTLLIDHVPYKSEHGRLRDRGHDSGDLGQAVGSRRSRHALQRGRRLVARGSAGTRGRSGFFHRTDPGAARGLGRGLLPRSRGRIRQARDPPVHRGAGGAPIHGDLSQSSRGERAARRTVARV